MDDIRLFLLMTIQRKKWGIGEVIIKKNDHPRCTFKDLLFLRLQLWPHSLMDKMQDSGSCDLGSIPGGVTDSQLLVSFSVFPGCATIHFKKSLIKTTDGIIAAFKCNFGDAYVTCH